jgi:hypothetical protein
VEFSVALNCDEELLEGAIVTTDGNGCVIYSADTTPGYFADTICIIAVDALGNTDTTVYIISVVPVIDTIIVPTDTLLCLDDVITVGGPVDTFYTCNGTVLDIDTTSLDCEVIIVIDDNFTIDTTEICIVTCSGPICDTTIVIVINEGFPPVAVDDFDTTSIDVPVVISVLENDFDLR